MTFSFVHLFCGYSFLFFLHLELCANAKDSELKQSLKKVLYSLCSGYEC